MTNEPFDLSFLDNSLLAMSRDQSQAELDRIKNELFLAIRSVDGEVAFKDFWLDHGVSWKDSRAGISRLGSLLHQWLSQKDVIATWDAENHLFEAPPRETAIFIDSTRTVLEIGLALGAILATREVDGK